jgi:hypothetical protein
VFSSNSSHTKSSNCRRQKRNSVKLQNQNPSAYKTHVLVWGFRLGFSLTSFHRKQTRKWEAFLAPTDLTQVGDLPPWRKVFCIILSSLS